jgi:hypothetical protein
MRAEELAAGPELDILLAERVMGWSCTAPNEHGPVYQIWRDAAGEWQQEVPAYSTDIAAAWRLQDVIPMTVYAPHASHADGEYENGERWSAEAVSPLCGPGNPYAAITAEGKDAPEAMCRCALLWSEARSRPQSKP